jgi:tetratricopeptide (TPR) repeat protein
MRAKTRGDLEFTKKVFELEEHHRAAKMCRFMIKRLTGRTEDADALVEFRSLLADVMMRARREDDPVEPIFEELDRVFTGYLSLGNRVAAAETLLRTAQFLEGNDWPRAFETGYKIVELFGGSANIELLEKVREAYSFLFRELPREDPDFATLCTRYARFLQNRMLNLADAVSTVLEIDNALDGTQNASAIKILQSFLEARSNDLSTAELDSLRSRLAANHLFVGNYEDAISACVYLLLHGEESSRPDYTLWCGEAFMKLGRDETAAMFFREVLRATDDEAEDEDDRARQARKYLNEVAPEAIRRAAEDPDGGV